ncbi:MAG TPA: ABC transporter permease [Planctomycetota bacterium]|nr:ABC transporter permease [Planctomycetota bacterium]
MLRYCLRRLAWTLPTLLLASFVAFVLLHLAPGTALDAAGDPSDAGSTNSAASVERFRREHLLDQPLWKQYFHYLGPFDLSERGHPWFGGSGERAYGGVLTGDLGGELLRPGVKVGAQIAQRLQVTLPLMLASLLLGYLVGIPLGVFSATRRGAKSERAITLATFALYAVPVFWAGVLLQSAFGRRGLDWLPVLWPAGEATASEIMRASVLPVICASYGVAAYVSRQTRASMLEALESDWVRSLRARGIPERPIVWRHALRNAAAPLCVHLGQILPALAAGSVLIETIFDVPGVGTYLHRGLLQREYDVVTGIVLMSALFATLGLLLSDLLHAALDPRIRA